MSTFNVFTSAFHFNHGIFNDGIVSKYGIGGRAIVSKTFPDFGLLRGPSGPQAASDGRVKIAAIEAVRILRHSRLPILLVTGFADLEGDNVADLPCLSKLYTQDQLASEIARLLPHTE
jgi:hypothetical protein